MRMSNAEMSVYIDGVDKCLAYDIGMGESHML